MISYLKKAKTAPQPDQGGSHGQPDILSAVEVTMNVINRLLQSEWDVDPQMVRKSFEAVLGQASDSLQSRIKDQRDAKRRVDLLLDEVEKPWAIKQVSVTFDGTANVAPSMKFDHSVWRTPTVEWLCQPELFTPAQLPKMQVPASKSRGVYDSREHYEDTMTRLMVGMAFSDGHAALAPHCFEKDMQGKTCGCTLWSLNSKEKSSGQLSCRTRGCNRQVVWACQNARHNRGLCAGCGQKELAMLMGPAGQGASTHVYDGRVSRVDVSGKLYIEGFESRNPPKNPDGKVRAIHWRSTKRLACPNLVGVVRLVGGGSSSSTRPKGRALHLSDPILWGELCNHDDPKLEDKRREAGRLCLNMMSITGSFEVELFTEGDVVALVDCMTFVPEYIPVLRALEELRLHALPFADGALLNMWQNRPADISNSIGQRKEGEVSVAAGAGTGIALNRTDVVKLVREMIEMSKLQPIREIRQSQPLTDELEQKIVTLIVETTLDKGQLVNFIDALRNPVHLTQGPPGTGKSYLGVVLTRALLRIRDLWMKQNPSVGCPPILALSYKNHAVDEFLVDIHDAERNSPGFNMIRMGNPGDPRLMPYSEKRFKSNDLAVKKCHLALDELNKLSLACKSLGKHALLFGSFRADMINQSADLTEDVQKKLNRVAYEATEVLLASIVRAKVIANILPNADESHIDDPWQASSSKVTEVLREVGPLLQLDDPDDVKVPWKTRKLLGRKGPFDEMPLLYRGLQHYIELDPRYDDPAEMLFMFIKGDRLLPRCSYVLDAQPDGEERFCSNLAADDNGVALCSEHRCQCVFGPSPARCMRQVAPGQRYLCFDHACTSISHGCCQQPRQGVDAYGQTVQKFCSDHACFKCCEAGIVPAREAQDKPPRHVCSDHPLCCVFDCEQLAMRGEDYCTAHTAPQCQHVHPSGVRCEKPTIARHLDYCDQHVKIRDIEGWGDSAEEDESQDEDAELPFALPKACAGKNKKGKPCGSAAMKGSKYCHAHAPPASSFTQQQQEDLVRNVSEPPDHRPTNDESGQPPAQPLPSKLPPELKEEPVLNMVVDSKENEALCLPPLGLVDAADGGHYDNLDEVDESDGLQHLREVFEVEEGHAVEDHDEIRDPDDNLVETTVDTRQASSAGAALGSEKKTAKMPAEWSWDMPLSERWEAFEDFMLNHKQQLERVLAYIRMKMPVERKRLQEAMVRASAKVYEDKSVIGGTIVGCIARLEAIRATNPFAIMLEEASEVLEPLLFACMSKSMVKLEMIGDHLQLSPSIMQKFEFERINKINVSMFERLIQAPKGHAVPNGVLCVQRRMRSDVADLTREYYKDIVEIEDHPISRTRVLPGSTTQRSFWMGREVPGVQSHVFLWTHNGAQTKADVGLSKINQHEASMAIHLAYYLTACGVERGSIAILTPYKGQLMLMRKMLLHDKSKSRLLTYDSTEKDQIRLSTVDRFQGDESDVVIASLVVDENSRTPFVKLVNRMIVLLSRARLGLYVLGNVGYFENSKSSADVKHWMRTFEMLQKPAATSDNDTTAIVARLGVGSHGRVGQMHLTDSLFEGVRVGTKLPLCCPEHPQQCVEVQKPEQLKLGFCKLLCQARLQCSHACGLQCHWPHTKHNKLCSVKLPSPCETHPEDVSCATVFANAAGLSPNADIEQALVSYRCPIKVVVTLPCQHEETMACSEERDIADGSSSWPACDRMSKTPYIYPSCGHTLEVSCSKLRKYVNEPTKAPRCNQLVRYTPPACDHAQDVKCWMKCQYQDGSAHFICNQRLVVSLPRCGHMARVSCAESIALLSWRGTRCEELDNVLEGGGYGPQDYNCQHEVNFKRMCGHSTRMPCQNAFSLAAAKVASPCTERVRTTNPFCGHNCSLPCHEATALRGVPAAVSSPLTQVHEGSLSPISGNVPRVVHDCQKQIIFVRRCGHSHEISCGRARKAISKCSESMSLQSPLCGHTISVPCCLLHDIKTWQPWHESDFSELAASHSLPIGAKPSSTHLPGDELLDVLKSCKGFTTVAKACGHPFKETCAQLLQVIENNGVSTKGGKCSTMVEKPLPCGHVVEVLCSNWQQHEAGKKLIQCQEKVQRPCWNVTECQSHSLSVPCSTPEACAVCCSLSLPWTCPARKHSRVLQLCSKGTPESCHECNSDELDHQIRLASEAVAHLGRPEGAPPAPHLGLPYLSFVERALAALVRADLAVELELPADATKKFWEAQKANLQKFKLATLETRDMFNRVQLYQRWIPVFFELDPKLASGQCKGFFPLKEFVRSETLQGICVYRMSEDNLLGLAKRTGNSQKTLLCGFLLALQAMEDVAWPSTKKARASIAGWKKKGWDCAEFQPDGGMRRLVVWDPYPLYATHRVGPLTDAQLQQLAADLSRSATISLAPRFVQYIKPAGGALLVQGKPGQTSTASAAALPPTQPSASAPPGSSAEECLQHVAELRGSWAGDLRFPTHWDSSKLALPVLGEKMQLDLSKKLCFFNPHLDLPPFAGKKLLERYLQKAADKGEDGKIVSPNLELLLALELESVSRDAELARVHLEKYRSASRSPAHPLALLALARIPGLLQPSETSSDEMLHVFSRLYPNAAERLLLTDEKERLQMSTANDGDAVDLADPPESRVEPSEVWTDLKDSHGCHSEAMETLLSLTGLRRVKSFAVQMFKIGLQFQQMDAATRQKNLPALNYCFLGNPGTGKTTVARLFAELLHDTQLRKSKSMIETSGQALKDKGTDEFLKEAKAAANGTLFIDEAYNLDPVGDRFKGGPIANELITISENQRETLTIILAGYEDDMNKKLFEYNPGLKSRFQEVVFEDFDESELLTLWTSMRESRGWREADPRLANVVVRRLVKASGTKHFGNARDVRKKLEEAVSRAMSRPSFDGSALVLEIEDAIGENPAQNEKLKHVLDEIDAKTGWRKIKTAVHDLVKLCSVNYERELAGQSPLPLFLNRMFLGNPGTGKTTCAKLYGQVLKHLGFLSNGEVLERTASDLGGSVVGEAKQKTLSLLEGARGKVLLIDEAYALDDGQYGKQSLDTLVEKVQGSETDDLAVLLLGYTDEMLSMMRNQNPGLARRFAPDQAFYFEDYTELELLKIMQDSCRRHCFKTSVEFLEKALKKLEMQRRCEAHFGNAGAVNNLLKAALQKAAARGAMVAGAEVCLDACDVDLGPEPEDDEDIFASLNKLHGMDHVKEKLQQLRNAYDLAEEEGEPMVPPGHFVFLGAPGTGKTTVARATAALLYKLGLIAKNQVIETSGLNLTGEYSGQTKKKVEEELNKAKGGVLFIDEAYELGQGQFGKEACSALVAAMTDPRYKSLVIIIAGYHADIAKMLDTNQGLKSRFAHHLEFPDWAPTDCASRFMEKARSCSFSFDDKVIEKILLHGFEKLLPLKGWGNARDVEKLWTSSSQKRADRMAAGGDRQSDERTLEVEDVSTAMRELVDARMGSTRTAHTENDGSADPFAPLDKLYRMEHVKKKLKQLQNTYAVAKSEDEEQPPLGHFLFLGAPGTGKTTVARAAADILYHLGLITRRHVIETSGLNLTGEYSGQTKKKVEEELDKAKGGVLFIDEAYELGQGQFGQEACTALVAAMTDPQYAGLVVIMAGYQAQMSKMLDTNPGLKSRIQHTLEFPDWAPEDCASFFSKKARALNFEFHEATVNPILLHGFKKLLPLDGWGNARDVERVWQATKEHRADRLVESRVDDPKKSFTEEDVRFAMDGLVAVRLGSAGVELDRSQTAVSDPFSALDKLYRMDGVKKKLQQLQSALRVAEADGEEAPAVGHFVFVGSPGTGKTTVARVAADILYNLGLISRRHVIETSGLNLTGEYSGQTKKKVEEELNKAKGGVLFIDEAYELGQGQFGKEACSALVAAMTDPRYKSLVIIIAGYHADIAKMLDTNQGLKSRFEHHLEFPDWAPKDCVDGFNQRAVRGNYTIHPEARVCLETGFSKLKSLNGWGNARDVEQVWKSTLQNRACRVVDLKNADRVLIEADIRVAMESLIKARESGSGHKPMQSISYAGSPPAREADGPRGPPTGPMLNTHLQTFEPDPPCQTCEAGQEAYVLTQEEACDVRGNENGGWEETKDEGEAADANMRDAGVSDAVWAELQHAKEEEKRRKEEAREQQLKAEVEHKRRQAELLAAYEAEQARIMQIENERQRLEAAARAREAYEAELAAERRQREEEEERRRREAREQEKIKEKLRQISPCPAGFAWTHMGNGWRCGGGSHFVSDAELKKNFTS